MLLTRATSHVGDKTLIVIWLSNNKEGIREKCEYTDSKLMMYMEWYMYSMKK